MGMLLSVKEALKFVVMRSGKTLTKIGEEFGYKQRASLSKMINKESIRLDMAASLVKACGYKLVIIPDDVEVDDVGGVEIKGRIEDVSNKGN